MTTLKLTLISMCNNHIHGPFSMRLMFLVCFSQCLPSHVSCGPGSKPKLHVHLNAPIILVQVPFPHIPVVAHSSASTTSEHITREVHTRWQ